MPVFAPKRINKDFAVRNSDYIRTENNPNEGEGATIEPVNPNQPEAK
jgi:hypothetical protein